MMEDILTHPGQIQLLGAHHALELLTEDLANVSHVYAWTYLIEPEFARQLLAEHLKHSQFSTIVDHRQRGVAQKLQQEFPNFNARSWSYNRTMHEKTFIFDRACVVWLGSHNMTKGSYTLSSNRAARIHSVSLAMNLRSTWLDQWETARRVPR